MMMRAVAVAVAMMMAVGAADGDTLTQSPGPRTTGDFNQDGFTDRLKYQETIDLSTHQVLESGVYIVDGECQCQRKLIDASAVSDIVFLETPQGAYISFEAGQPRAFEWWRLNESTQEWEQANDPGANCPGTQWGEICFAEGAPIEIVAVYPCGHYGCTPYGGQFTVNLSTGEQTGSDVSVAIYNPVTGALHTSLTAEVGPDFGQWNCPSTLCHLQSEWCETRGAPTTEDPSPARWEWDAEVTTWDGERGNSTRKEMLVVCP